MVFYSFFERSKKKSRKFNIRELVVNLDFKKKQQQHDKKNAPYLEALLNHCHNSVRKMSLAKLKYKRWHLTNDLLTVCTVRRFAHDKQACYLEKRQKKEEESASCSVRNCH